MAGPPTGLRKDLGLFTATAILVGNVIGSGIFLGPEAIANALPAPGLVLLVWIAGGALVLAGALSYAELAALYPRSGGEYQYLRAAYGRFAAYMSGWSLFTVGKTAAAAALALAFARYFNALLPIEASLPLGGEWRLVLDVQPLGAPGSHLLAALLLVALTVVNVLGVRYGGWVSGVTTSLKVLALLAIAGLGLLAASQPTTLTFAPAQPIGFGALVSGFLLSLVFVLWAYDGWTSSTLVAEEVAHPTRNVPRALVLGCLLVIGVYVVANVAYLNALGVAGIAGSQFAAVDSTRALAEGVSPGLGDAAAKLVVVAVLVSVLGTANAVILSGPRTTFAMARDGIFFRRLSQVHPKYGTPAWAIATQGALAVVLTFTGGFEQIVTYVIFTSWIFYGMSVGAVLVLRRTRPDAERPFRTPGYPFVPLLFILVSAAFVVNTLLTQPKESAIGLAFLATGVPFYWYWTRSERGRGAAGSQTPPAAPDDGHA